MEKPPRGLYETLITDALEAVLRPLPASHAVDRVPLRPAEAPDRIALHLARVVEMVIASLPDDERVARGTELARRLITALAPDAAANDIEAQRPVAPASVLRAVLALQPDGAPEALAAPLIPLLDTTLLTNAPGEPRVGHQLLAEIASADRVDVVMAFVRQSGIAPFLPALRRHCEAGRALRVLTTTYTGSTEARALDALQRVGAEVKVSYEHGSTRLHAKAWLFHRRSRHATAYIGSSNLTHAAQVTGLEWNVRVSQPRNPAVIDKVAAVFESYWHGGDFVPYRRADFEAHLAASEGPDVEVLLSPIELRLEPFQERLLELVALSRAQGRHRNLLVSATGTGKTVMAAVDYARLREALPRARLLLVAHREEILRQSLATFRHALRDPSFGELWVGGRRPARFEHVFASVQSLSAAGLQHLAPDHFDVAIVDEFHHAAADSYRALLGHLRPVELLGLTATPERSDGLTVLDWFDGRIAAELRLWDAIDQHRLVPFVYYGVHGGLDFRGVPWRRGSGYDTAGLSNLLTANDAWARLVLDEVVRRVERPSRMRALGFCVSVEHARFMARAFNAVGVASLAVWSDTPEAERRRCLADLAAGRVSVVFTVDLFNEGVDVPSVDTLILLRPTDSPTLFLQQLGRGLRRAPGKSACTVLDFIGDHRPEFRLERRYAALLGRPRAEVEAQLRQGFPFLPAGCHLELDRRAEAAVLASIKAAVPSHWTAKVDALRARGPCSLRAFLTDVGLELEELYRGGRSWSDLCADAGLPVAPSGPHEAALRRACGRLLHVDDAVRIEAYRALASRADAPDLAGLPVAQARLARMLVGSVADRVLRKTDTLADALSLLRAHPQVCAEIAELMDALAERVSHLPATSGRADVPLQVHARYTRIEMLAAVDVGEAAKVAPWQTGVYWAKEARIDLLAFTLDKTSGQFSPTTRYRDHAVSRERIHWESQSATRADGETGLRYQRHVRLRSSVYLFARERADARAFYFLGPATYETHESEQPMAITWRLAHPLPGDLFVAFAAAVA